MDMHAPVDAPRGGWRLKLRTLVDHPSFQNAIIALIAINAVTLGLETSGTVMSAVGGLLLALDRIILAIFVVEIALRMTAHGPPFFRDPWSLFDTAVVAIALVPASTSLSVLRALRVLRVLRLISAVPRMRVVVQALLSAIPGLGAIVALLLLILYVSAVMTTKLFGAEFPELFGSLPASLFTLFQILTLEGWSDGIVRPVMEVYPYAWLFFVPFILIATFTILNLFIAVVVGAMQAEHEVERAAEAHAAEDKRSAILEELRELKQQVADLRRLLDRSPET